MYQADTLGGLKRELELNPRLGLWSTIPMRFQTENGEAKRVIDVRVNKEDYFARAKAFPDSTRIDYVLDGRRIWIY